MNTVQEIKRDRAIDAAVTAGKFTAKRTGFWRERWDADPAGTESAIALMAGGLTDPPVHVTMDADLVKFFSGGRVESREPEPPEAAQQFVTEVLGLKGVSS